MPYDQVSFNADISSIKLDELSEEDEPFSQPKAVRASTTQPKKKKNRFNREKRTLPNGEKRQLKNMFTSDQAGLTVQPWRPVDYDL